MVVWYESSEFSVQLLLSILLCKYVNVISGSIQSGGSKNTLFCQRLWSVHDLLSFRQGTDNHGSSSWGSKCWRLSDSMLSAFMSWPMDKMHRGGLIQHTHAWQWDHTYLKHLESDQIGAWGSRGAGQITDEKLQAVRDPTSLSAQR